MVTLAFALALSMAQAAPDAAPAPATPATKVSKADTVTCKWVTNSGGIANRICLTGRQWRNEQLERQRRVDDFQRRALTTSPRM
jgi:hypothetical protein